MVVEISARPLVLSGDSLLSGLRRMVGVYLKRDRPISFDTETTGLNPRTDKLISLQFWQEGGETIIADVRRADLWVVGEILAPLFGNCCYVGMNLKFDYQFMRVQCGIRMVDVYDVMLSEQLIHGLGKSDAQSKGVSFNLKAIAEKYGVPVSKEERNWFIDLDKRPAEWSSPFPPEQVEYMAQDVKVLAPIMQKQIEALDTWGLNNVAGLEMEALPAIAEIELAGVRVDVEGWRGIIAEKEQEAEALAEEIGKIYGAAILEHRAIHFDIEREEYDAWVDARDLHLQQTKDTYNSGATEGMKWGEYKNAKMKEWRTANPNPGRPKPDISLPNINSHAQMVAAFQVLGIPATSTADDILKELEEEYPQVQLLRKHSKLHKFTTSFGETLLRFVDPVTGRIHPEYEQIGASTGRMSCRRPNWQQVPSKGDGIRLRGMVKAAEGNKILTADFSNIELRILADITGDTNMLRFFAEEKDLHAETARMMFGLGPALTKDEIKKLKSPEGYKYRDAAKTINFGLVYGMSSASLAKQLSISKDKGEEMMQAYFTLYPGVAEWLAEQRRLGVLTKRSRTLSGRLRQYDIPDRPQYDREPEKLERWKTWNRARGRAERQACNTPIQGTSADITKLALANWQQRNRTCATLIAVVHDELVVECPDTEIDLATDILAHAMDDAAKYFLKRVALPLPDVVVADHWTKD